VEIIKHKQWDNTIKYKHGGDTLESSNLGNTMYKKTTRVDKIYTQMYLQKNTEVLAENNLEG